jgi:myo-inositol 2-dehydrogenase / D-chiro-inositol 1-dehydrogenase
MTLGIGFLGAGPATQAIHLPVLASMAGRLRVLRIMDPITELAGRVAARAGARPSSEAEILKDEGVSIVVICSPNAFHASQIVACCQAQKRLVLCEKPLALTPGEATLVAQAARASGTRIVVGTQHAYDLAYREARARWRDDGDVARLIQSSIYLPGNSTYVGQATDLISVPSATAASGAVMASRAQRLRGAILGLTIHDLPLIRSFAPELGTVLHARIIDPFGYSMSAANGKQVVVMSGLMPGQWEPHWHLRVEGHDTQMIVRFPPSYVLAGSAKVELRTRGRATTLVHPVSGYEAMWTAIADCCENIADIPFSLEDVLGDLDLAFALADAASAKLMDDE